MKWCRFKYQNEINHGIIENNMIFPISGNPFSKYKKKEIPLSFEEIELLIPVYPKTFYAVGVNYMNHVIKMSELTGRAGTPPPAPDVGYRANNALIAHNKPIIIPEDATEKVQYEGELVVVIGKKAKNLNKENVFEHIFGYTIGNDVSERSWQSNDRTLWRAKNSDTFKPMGPWIETNVDLENMITTIRVNNEIKDQFKTNDMIFGISEYIINITKYITLYPGDVIWMGTDEVPSNIKNGDIVDIEISGIGILSNPVIKQ